MTAPYRLNATWNSAEAHGSGRTPASHRPSLRRKVNLQATPNRSSVQVGAAAATTYTFDDANRVTADSTGGTHTADADGRLTSRPGQRLVWDSLGRLTKVLPPTGAGTLATYTYDPLDRLLLADDGTTRTRFRYVG